MGKGVFLRFIEPKNLRLFNHQGVYNKHHPQSIIILSSAFRKIRSANNIFFKMNPIFPVIPALDEAMSDFGLPVELWAIILRKVDPKSLLVAVKTYPHWLNIDRGDPLLRRTIRKQMKMEERARQQEEINSGLLTTITRSQVEASSAPFRSNPNTKNVQRRARTVLTAPELAKDFGLTKNSGPGPIRRKKS